MSAGPRLFSTRTALGLAALVVIFIVIIIVTATGRHSSHSPRTFEIEMQVSAGTVAELFWSADTRFVGARSVRVPLLQTPDAFQNLRFPLPPEGVRWLRFDPTDAPGDVLIGKVRLLDANGQVLQTFDARSFKPINQIASITEQGEVTKITTTPAATDPVLFLALGGLDRFPFWSNLSLVTPVALALASAVVIALLGACVLVIGRAAFGIPQGVVSLATELRSRRLSLLWLSTLFLIVFSAKLLLMRDNPATVPFWDQWDGEASALFVPFHESSLGWRTMFDLHNEHRVFFTRLLALALLEVNGQWDPRLEQVVDAAIHSFTAVLLAVIFWLASERRRLDLVALVCVVCFALPFSWENTLLGFQSAFYFLLLFSVLALWLTTAYRVGTGSWCLGWICAVCGLFTAASGVITPLAIAGVVALKLASDRQPRESVINGGAAALVLALGIAVAAPPLAHHAVLKAKTAADFLSALAQGLAWPWIDRPLLSVVMWLPVGAVLVAAALRRARTTVLERLAVGLGIWVVLTAGAVAYGRGAGAPLPAIRYLDFLSLGFIANVMALVAILDRTRPGAITRQIALGTLVGWLLFAIVGVDRLVGRALTDLSVWRQYFAAQASSVRKFMITGDVSELLSKRPLDELPYPDPNRMVALLEDPYIRGILPAAARQPLHMEPRAITNDAFVMESPYAGRIPSDPLARSWWSLSDQGKRAQGRFESQPLACQLGGHLKIQVSGYLGWKGQYLAVKDLRTGRDLPVKPARLAREDWTDAFVSCPPGPFEIVAIDETPDSWFGFREPVEIGWGSIAAESLIGMSREVVVVLLAAAVLALAVRWT